MDLFQEDVSRLRNQNQNSAPGTIFGNFGPADGARTLKSKNDSGFDIIKMAPGLGTPTNTLFSIFTIDI